MSIRTIFAGVGMGAMLSLAAPAALAVPAVGDESPPGCPVVGCFFLGYYGAGGNSDPNDVVSLANASGLFSISAADFSLLGKYNVGGGAFVFDTGTDVVDFDNLIDGGQGGADWSLDNSVPIDDAVIFLTIKNGNLGNGNDAALYGFNPPVSTGTFTHADLLKDGVGNPHDISHVEFWQCLGSSCEPDDPDEPQIPVPAPATLLLLGSALVGLGVARRRRR